MMDTTTIVIKTLLIMTILIILNIRDITYSLTTMTLYITINTTWM